jgi:integrase
MMAEGGGSSWRRPRLPGAMAYWSEPWGDFRHYAINMLAASTGMRMGEIRALLVENVKDNHVEKRRS